MLQIVNSQWRRLYVIRDITRLGRHARHVPMPHRTVHTPARRHPTHAHGHVMTVIIRRRIISVVNSVRLG